VLNIEQSAKYKKTVLIIELIGAVLYITLYITYYDVQILEVEQKLIE